MVNKSLQVTTRIYIINNNQQLIKIHVTINKDYRPEVISMHQNSRLLIIVLFPKMKKINTFILYMHGN